MALEHLAHLVDHAVAQDQGVPHRLAADVERAVAQPQCLVDFHVLIDREGRRRRARQQLDLIGGELDLAGCELGVDVLARALDEPAGHADHILAAQLVGDLVRRAGALGVEHELQQPRAVAQVDEDQAAVVAAAVYPTGDADLAARVGGAQLAAPAIAVAVRCGRGLHAATSRSTSAERATVSSVPARMSRRRTESPSTSAK